MESLVLELQREAYNGDSSITNLLRKAYIVSRKLNIVEFQKWIKCEINGYNSEFEAPEYRQIYSELKAFNPYRGWVSTQIVDRELEKSITTIKVTQSVSELEALTNSDSEHVSMIINGACKEILCKMFKYSTDYKLVFSKAQIQSILDRVRNIVLEWSLRLEEDGIVGEGMTFTDAEKKVAQKKGNSYNFYLNGNFTDSPIQVQNETISSTQNMGLNEAIDTEKLSEYISFLKSNIDNLKLEHSELERLNSAVEGIEGNLDKKLSQKRYFKEGLATIRNIIEGVTGSIIASALLSQLPLFL